MKMFSGKSMLVVFLVLVCLISGVWAATTKQPAVKIDIGTVTSDVGSGTVTGYGNGSGYGTYSWGVYLQKALNEPKNREIVQSIVETCMAQGDSPGVMRELITATLMNSGASFYVNGSLDEGFDYNSRFNVAYLNARINGLRTAAVVSNQVTATGQGTVAVSMENVGLADVTLTGEQTYTEYKVNAVAYVSPLVLDMDGDGKLAASGGNWMPHPEKIYKDNMRTFDLLSNDFEYLTEWVGKGDGLLCEPKADGTVDGSCLFGPYGGYNNGFDKLSLRDVNGDKRLTDKELDGLFVWMDKNGNARANQGELISAKAAGISMMGVAHNNFTSYFMMNGEKRVMWDWWPNCMNLMKVAVRGEK